MISTDVILKGIAQEADRHTVDVSDKKIDLPSAFETWRSGLQYEFESSGHRLDPRLLFDKGSEPEVLKIRGSVSKAGIYIQDVSRFEPRAPHAHLQICRIQTDRLGRLTKVTISVDKDEFFQYMRQLAPHSNLFEQLSTVELPSNFPSGKPDFEVFDAAAKELLTQSLHLVGLKAG